MEKHLVVITGASRGIGFAISRMLLQKSYSVHMIARTEASLRIAKESLSELGNVTYSVVDLSSREQIAEHVRTWNQRIWGLINNAGKWKEERLDEPDTGIWDDIMKLNLDGVHFLTKGLLPWIMDSGRIVNISSQLGTSGRAKLGEYAASKHAVNGLTRCRAEELGASSDLRQCRLSRLGKN